MMKAALGILYSYKRIQYLIMTNTLAYYVESESLILKQSPRPKILAIDKHSSLL
jgi:hypothetical protein